MLQIYYEPETLVTKKEFELWTTSQTMQFLTH